MSLDMLSSAVTTPCDDASTVVTSNLSHPTDQGRVSNPSDQGRVHFPTHLPLNAIDLHPLDCPPLDNVCSDPPAAPPELQAPAVDDDPDVPRAQIDTGAFVSCTGSKSLLHNYREFTPEFPCPVKLLPATDGSDAIPLGFGYLHVPASNSAGFLPVRTFYHPAIRTTVIDERDFIRAAGHKPCDIVSENILKFHNAGTFTYRAIHWLKNSLNVLVHGILESGKCYSAPLLLPYDADPSACPQSPVIDDPNFVADCHKATLYSIYAYQETLCAQLKLELQDTPIRFHHLPFHQYIQSATPVSAIKAEAERFLWHQRLGHPSDYYLYNAHKFVKGVPKFKKMKSVLDQCPTCIRAKQTKEPAGPNTTRTATEPYQGLSIDFSFSGVKSKDKTRESEYLGLNGETSWILLTDHFTRMKHGDTRVSKASPIHWLRHFLEQHAPNCPGKYVFLDQGGELYHNP